MIHYNGENFDELVSNGIYLVDFYADWCSPCRMLSSVLESVQDKIKIIKVNVDEYNELANRFKIMSIPHLIFFKNGKVVSSSVGFIDKDTLEEKILEVNNL